MDLSGDEIFEIIPKTREAYESYKGLLLTMRELFSLNIDNLRIAILIDRFKQIFYYHVVYENSNDGNPDIIYLSNVSGRTLTLNCGMFAVPIETLSIISMTGFSKWGHEGYLRRIGIKIPWIRTNVANTSQYNEKKTQRKRRKKM